MRRISKAAIPGPRSNEEGETIVVSVDKSNFYEQLKAMARGCDFACQLAENDYDAGADSINFVVDDDREVVSVQGNGSGFGVEGRRSFPSLGKSFKRKGNRPIKGKYGTGAKSAFGVASTIMVEDVCPEDELSGRMVVMTLDRDETIARYAGENREGQHTYIVKRDSSLGQSGSRVTVSGFDRGRFLRGEILRERLSDGLAPFIAEMVRVNGERLPEREIVGERIRFTREHAILGTIRVDLYIPKRRRFNDRLRIGSIGPVCEVHDFFLGITDKNMKVRFPQILLDPAVCGIIDVEKFNEFSVQSRHEFDGALFSRQELHEFIYFLQMEVEPELSGKLQDTFSKNEQERAEEMVCSVTELFHKAFGVPQVRVPGRGHGPAEGGDTDEDIEDQIRPPTGRKDIQLNIGQVEIICGEELEIFVARYGARSSGQFNFDGAASGGTLFRTENTRTWYRAGNTAGIYILQVVDRLHPDVSANVTIKVVTERQFRVSPRTARIPCGEKITLRAINTEVITNRNVGGLRWRASGGGRLLADSGSEAVFQSGGEEGTFTVTCYHPEFESIQSECTIRVERALQLNTADRTDSGRGFLIEGKHYVMVIRKFDGIKEMARSAGEGNNTIFVNGAHSAVRKALETGSRAFMGQIAVDVHVGQTYPQFTPDEVFLKAGELMELLFAQEMAPAEAAQA